MGGMYGAAGMGGMYGAAGMGVQNMYGAAGMGAQTMNRSVPMGGQPVMNSSMPVDAVAEIQRFKALMDQGIISEAEFEAKKRQLLGL
ncbi:MAG: SHOCT domain-containing protein [Clostridia bacterium]|nr:SHOCT domain-containing protein [Clostridia bacterium]